jgi:sensor histidine kinase YesM
MILIVTLAAAVASTLMLLKFEPALHLNALFQNLIMGVVYSFCIVAPAAILLVRLGRKRLAQNRVIGWFPRVAILLGASAAGCLTASLLLVPLGYWPLAAYWTVVREATPLCTVMSLAIGLGVSLYRETQARLERAELEVRTRQMEEERAHKLAAQARLSSLESRIHPHFLFNTLNSIASLIPKDPRRAEDMVGKLASLLRFSLNANQTGLVPLEQELRTVQDYLEIEKARYDTRLRYRIAIPAEVNTAGVPPLSLQSLVENSIKHVIAHRPEGGEIAVRGSTQNGRLDLEVSDDGPGFCLESAPPGHGLDNLAARLHLLFGEEARLETARNGKYAIVRLSFPVNA